MTGNLFPYFRRQGELTLAELFGFILRHHLADRPSGSTFRSNVKWWCQTTGNTKVHQLTDLDTKRHLHAREFGNVGRCKASPQSRKHDIKALVLALNTARRWKQKRRVLDGFQFARLKLPEFSPADPKEVRRPKTSPRQHPVTPEMFSRFFEHCHEDLQERLIILNDTGLSPKDAKRLEPSWYNEAMDVIRFPRHKTGEPQNIPVTTRVRRIILKAIGEKRQLVLKWNEHDHRRQVDAARWASKVYFQVGRDLRKQLGNDVYESSGHNPQVPQKVLGHTTEETFMKHYRFQMPDDVRPYVQQHSHKYGGPPATMVRIEAQKFSSN